MATVEEPIALDSTLQRVADALEGGSIATTTKAGKVMPDGEFILVGSDGAINFISTAPDKGLRNGIFRGKYLGDNLSSTQAAAISAGTFDDLFIGDYWTIGGVNYRIAAFDYWLRCGDTECTKHHVVVVPDTSLYNAQMNATNTTEGGYIGSAMYKTNLANAKTTINNAFGSAHILVHRELLINAVANGKPSAGSWYDSDVELMNEQMVYGNAVFEPANDGTTIPYKYTIDKTQLSLFALRPDLITTRATWWLRSVVSASTFAYVNSDGYADNNSASYSFGVRPAFAIC